MNLFKNRNELLTVASIIFAEINITSDQTNNLINAISILIVGLNRLNKPKYFKCSSLYEVFIKQKQFSCYPDSQQFKKAMGGLINIKDKYEYFAMRDIITMLELFNTQSDHYYNPDLCAPNWAKNSIGELRPIDNSIGDHVFMTLAM